MQNANTLERGASPEAIQRHYDVGSDFYGLWLDDTMSYSCALWEPGDTDDDLKTAQLRKIDYHIESAHAANSARVLDIGCGWGATLRRLVREYGVQKAVGLTLSLDQEEHIASRPDARIEVRLESWLDHEPALPYDAIISIGAFEHFARPDWSSAEKANAYRAFFARCHDWLTPGTYLSLQTIAYGNLDPDEARHSPGHRFLLHEIFPETELPTLSEIVRAGDGLFEFVTLRNDRDDYRRTCRVWFNRLMARKADALERVGEEVVARYLRYLKLSATLFNYGQTALYRIAFRRLDEPRKWPALNSPSESFPASGTQ
jgi:cyclopropane-fatty-acyl-phospholipid synthase